MKDAYIYIYHYGGEQNLTAVELRDGVKYIYIYCGGVTQGRCKIYIYYIVEALLRDGVKYISCGGVTQGRFLIYILWRRYSGKVYTCNTYLVEALLREGV